MLFVFSVVGASTPTSYNTIYQNEQINLDERLRTSDSSYRFEVQSDQNLVHYGPGGVYYVTGTADSGGQHLILHQDGNLVFSTASNSTIWASGTDGSGAVRFTLNEDGSLVLYDSSDTRVWALHSATTENPGALTADPAKGEWTLVVIPDTQGYTENWMPNYPYAYLQQAFDWILSVSTQLNVQVVQSVGDMIEDNNATEWGRIRSCYQPLMDAGIACVPCGGNHESYDDPPYSMMNQYFPVSEFRQYAWWGGDMGNIQNTYQLFEFGNDKYLLLTLEFQPGKGSIVDWGEGVVDAHPDRKVIMSSHWNDGTHHYDQIVGVKTNMVMSFAGHKCAEEHYVGANGSHSFVIDYQCATGKMNLRYYKFKPLENRVEFFTYSPITGEFEDDDFSQGAFTLIQEGPTNMAPETTSTPAITAQ